MMLPLLLMVQDVAPQDAVGDDIVVMGKRLDAWRGRFRIRGGRVTCKTTLSTRDRAVDAIGCDALVSCLTPIVPQFQDIVKTEIEPNERQRKLSALLQTRHACLTDTRKAGIARLVAERRAK